MFLIDIDAAVDCLRPLLKKLIVREDFRGDKCIYTIEIPEMDFLKLEKCKITILRERLPDAALCGQLVVRYYEIHNLLHFMIYLNEHLFFNEDVARKNRRIVAVHEFTHIAAHIFAFSADKEKYFHVLEHKLNKKIDEIYKTDVKAMLEIFEEQNYSELNIHDYINHSHFTLDSEMVNFSYTELYYNLLFSKGAFEEYFDLPNQKKFYYLWQNNSRSEAIKFYRNIVIEAAEGKWVPVKFALNQAFEWLKKYIQNPL